MHLLLVVMPFVIGCSAPLQDTFECKNAAVDMYGPSFKPVTELNEMLRVSHTDETLPLSEPNYQRLATKRFEGIRRRCRLIQRGYRGIVFSEDLRLI